MGRWFFIQKKNTKFSGMWVLFERSIAPRKTAFLIRSLAWMIKQSSNIILQKRMSSKSAQNL